MEQVCGFADTDMAAVFSAFDAEPFADDGGGIVVSYRFRDRAVSDSYADGISDVSC